LCSNELTLVSPTVDEQPESGRNISFHQNRRISPNIAPVSAVLYLVCINRCMKQKDKLSHKQFQIIRREHLSTQEVDKWIRTASLNTETFSTTPVQLLQAQALTHTLLTQHQDLLTQSQQQALRHFQQLMAHKNTRSKLKPEATYPVFNISSKINRQLFKQHRQLTQA
jgi:hypothetical protein